MNETAVRQLAQSDPVPNLTANWTSLAVSARKTIETLTTLLRNLDDTRDMLAEHEITVDVDLGPIGNAAAAARRDLEREKPSPTFRLPT